eukprot:NODE_12131_length_1244_cov_3.585497.p1 GENE.NODE_12131_length_1244_cov_3.585497~~NODE_12131_length_1244_cov_3.585497.p1  ORF type:complete len:217 (-),score=62.77 NODE_12131_length_1244_cov_3.585497:237-887(-)
MHDFHQGQGGGCFGATSTVLVIDANGLEVSTAVAAVRGGDLVRVAGAGGAARVRCVAKIARGVAAKPLVQLPGGLTITPRHPVRVAAGIWRRAEEIEGALQAPSTVQCAGFVYNFVLDRSHVLLVNGLECVTWGHGIEGELISHAYYGSNRIVEDLAAMPGWEAGVVTVGGRLRDASGRVVGLCASGARRPLAGSGCVRDSAGLLEACGSAPIAVA